MEPACSEGALKEEDDLEATHGDGEEGLHREEAAAEVHEAEEEDEEAEEEEEADAAEDMLPPQYTETTLTQDSLPLVILQEAPSEPEQFLHSYGDLPLVEQLHPNPNPNSNIECNPNPGFCPPPELGHPPLNPNPGFYPLPELAHPPLNPNPNPNPGFYPLPELAHPPHNPNPNPSPIIQANKIDYDDFLDDDRTPEIHLQSHDAAKHLVSHSTVADDHVAIISPAELSILMTSTSELHTIPEIGAEEEICKEDMCMQHESEKENLGGGRAHAGANHNQIARRSPRLIKNLPPLLPITQQQSMAPPLKANKREQVCRKLPVNEGIKPVNEGIKPAIKMTYKSSDTSKQRQPALPVNYRSAIKRRVSNDSNEHNLPSPSSRDNEEEPSNNCSRASIESSPCPRQQGCISLDDVRRFSTLHTTSRSNSRLERFSLRGGKIDRVARFAQLQKIWKKDSFVRGIDGEKRPQILHHLFAPTRTT